jgi:CheY-like chemotaxis protein
MDNFDGFRLLETLKESPGTSDIPVIMLTTQEPRQGEWKTGAAVEYLAKGFTLAELIQRVNSILNITSTS